MNISERTSTNPLNSAYQAILSVEEHNSGPPTLHHVQLDACASYHNHGRGASSSGTSTGVIRYEDSDSREAFLMRRLVEYLPIQSSVGESVDCFGMLPQFEDLALDSPSLLRTCK